MTSLLCQKSLTGTIVNENQELYEKFLREPTKIAPAYLIKENNIRDSIFDFDSYTHSESQAKSSLKNGITNSKNNVMFNLPNKSKSFREEKNTFKARHRNQSLYSQNPDTLKCELKQDLTTNSSTLISASVKDRTDSSLSSATLNRFNSNSNHFQHEKKQLSRKKLKNVQQQLENRLNMKSATTNDIYKELDKIVEDEKTLVQKINYRVELSERDKARKREIIYKNWYRNVYEPMQSEIYNLMASNQAELARNLRNLKYLEYLNQCNKRARCYQDDFEPSEYNPIEMVNLDASLHENLLDPTLLTRRKESRELGIIAKNNKLPVINKHESPRSDIVWNNWIMEKYNTIDSTIRIKSARKCNPSRHLSEYNLEWDRGNPYNKSIMSMCNRSEASYSIEETQRRSSE